MGGKVAESGKGGVKASVLLAGCVAMLALPSAVLAFTTGSNPPSHKNAADLEPIDPVGASNGYTRAIAVRSLAKGKTFPFTPANSPSRPDRLVTVAVRVDATAAKAITVRGILPMAQVEKDTGQLRIAPTGFNLGVSRGYRSFSQALVQPPLRGVGELPDLKKYSLAPGTKSADSRFSPRLSVDDREAAGRAPRTFAGDSGEVDFGGAYRVTENINVTAGVRYSQERERIMPITDGKLDNQAVYVGTQFQF